MMIFMMMLMLATIWYLKFSERLQGDKPVKEFDWDAYNKDIMDGLSSKERQKKFRKAQYYR